MPAEISAILSMVGTLLLIIAIFVGAYYASKAIGKKYQGLGPSMKDGMELIDRKPVGKEESLLVVKIGGRVFLLGATPYSIQKIEELDPTLFPDKPTLPTESNVNFGTVWKDVLQKHNKNREGNVKNGD